MYFLCNLYVFAIAREKICISLRVPRRRQILSIPIVNKYHTDNEIFFAFFEPAVLAAPHLQDLMLVIAFRFAVSVEHDPGNTIGHLYLRA